MDCRERSRAGGGANAGSAQWARRGLAGALAGAALLVTARSNADQVTATARDGFYFDVHASAGLMVNRRDDGERGEANDGVEHSAAVEGGIALGFAPRPGLAVAGQVGVLGGDPGHMAIIGHAGPMLEWFPGQQRRWHLEAGPSFAMGWFGSGSDLVLPAPPPTDNQLLGFATFIGGGMATGDRTAVDLVARVTGAALFGEGTQNYMVVLSAGLGFLVF